MEMRAPLTTASYEMEILHARHAANLIPVWRFISVLSEARGLSASSQYKGPLPRAERNECCREGSVRMSRIVQETVS